MTKQNFYGWKIVWAILVQLTFTSGLSFYNHAIYLNALAAQPSFDVQSASSAVSIFFLSGGFTGLYVAKLVQDYDPRVSITLGALMASLSLCALPFVASLVQLFVVYVVFGAGFAASALIPATTLVTRWFQRRRAMALSVASTGLSLGGVVLTPLSAFMIDTLGFRLAMPLLALLFVLGVIPVSLIWLRPDPESMDLLPTGIRPCRVKTVPNRNLLLKAPERPGRVLLFNRPAGNAFFGEPVWPICFLCWHKSEE